MKRKKISKETIEGIQNARKNRGWTHEKLAKHFRVSVSTVGRALGAKQEKEIRRRAGAVLDLQKEIIADLRKENEEEKAKIAAKIAATTNQPWEMHISGRGGVQGMATVIHALFDLNCEVLAVRRPGISKLLFSSATHIF